MAEALRSVECGVCLRGEKICHFGVVVYSNVRERAPMRGRHAPPYLPPFRSAPLPSPPLFPSPPLLFHPHTRTSERDLPPATSGHASPNTRKTSTSSCASQSSRSLGESVRASAREFGPSLPIVSKRILEVRSACLSDISSSSKQSPAWEFHTFSRRGAATLSQSDRISGNDTRRFPVSFCLITRKKKRKERKVSARRS